MAAAALAAACAAGPGAEAFSATVPQRGVVTIRVAPADAGVEVVSVSQPTDGLAQIGPAGTVVYTPATLFTGEDRFTYTLADGAGRLATGSIVVTVVPVNDPPEARHDLFTITWQEALAGARLEVLRNDADPDGDALRVTAATGGALGTTRLAGDGAAVIYQARERFRDVDTFDYTVSDGVHETTTWAVVQVTDPEHSGPPPRRP